jgi:hypothetical protein
LNFLLLPFPLILPLLCCNTLAFVRVPLNNNDAHRPEVCSRRRTHDQWELLEKKR